MNISQTVAKVEPGAGHVVVQEGGDLLVINLGTATYSTPDVPYDVRVTLGAEGAAGDRATVDELAFVRRPGGDPISARGIQRATPARFIAAAFRALSQRVTVGPDGRPEASSWFGALLAGVDYRGPLARTEWLEAADYAAGVHAPDRRRRRSPEKLRRVAEVYHQALFDGEPTGAAVLRELGDEVGVSTADTARSWIQRAREAGLIPPARSKRPSIEDYEGWTGTDDGSDQ